LKRYFEKCVTNDFFSVFWRTAALKITLYLVTMLSSWCPLGDGAGGAGWLVYRAEHDGPPGGQRGRGPESAAAGPGQPQGGGNRRP